MGQPHYLSAKALVVRDGKLLLAKQEDGRWELPGGGVEPGETPTQAVIREVQEECGLTATILDQRPKYVWIFHPDQETNPTCCIGYHVELNSLNFTPSRECLALEFFDKDSIQQIPVYPYINQVFAFFNPTDFSSSTS